MASSPSKEVENPQMENPKAQASPKSTTIEVHGDEFWSLSGKPYFHIILSRSHVKPLYHMMVPAKIQPVLPSLAIPVFLTCKGKTWEMLYHGERRSYKNFDTNWKNFVDDNGLIAGDACVFELMECSNKLLNFRVQILRGDIQSEILDKENGESADTPIIIE